MIEPDHHIAALVATAALLLTGACSSDPSEPASPSPQGART